jgi:hypothetical protein
MTCAETLHLLARFELCELGRDLREVLEPRRSFGQVPIEPPQRRFLVLRRSSLCVELHELPRILERQVRKLAGGVLGSPEGSVLDRATEANVRVCFGRHPPGVTPSPPSVRIARVQVSRRFSRRTGVLATAVLVSLIGATSANPDSARVTKIPGCAPQCLPPGLIQPGNLPAGKYQTSTSSPVR